MKAACHNAVLRPRNVYGGGVKLIWSSHHRDSYSWGYRKSTWWVEDVWCCAFVPGTGEMAAREGVDTVESGEDALL